MRHLTSNTYVSPTKEQILTALRKVLEAYKKYKPIVLYLEAKEVTVSKWFGLRKKTMTMDEHIQEKGKGSFIPYYLRALMLGYITPEEYKICNYVMESPTLTKLRQWHEADQVLLGEFDHNEFIFALTEDFE